MRIKMKIKQLLHWSLQALCFCSNSCEGAWTHGCYKIYICVTNCRVIDQLKYQYHSIPASMASICSFQPVKKKQNRFLSDSLNRKHFEVCSFQFVSQDVQGKPPIHMFHHLDVFHLRR